MRIFLSSMCSLCPCGSGVVYPIINGLVPSPPRFEIRQFSMIPRRTLLKMQVSFFNGTKRKIPLKFKRLKTSTTTDHRLNCVIRPSDLTERGLSCNIRYFKVRKKGQQKTCTLSCNIASKQVE